MARAARGARKLAPSADIPEDLMAERRALTFAVLLFLAVQARAEVLRPECGVSPLRQQFVVESGDWAMARANTLAASKGLVAANATMRDDVVLLAADDLNAPFRRPVDLAGKTLSFTRTGSSGYRVTATALQWDETPGETLILDGMVNDERYGRVDLGFSLPFFDGFVETVFATSQNALLIEEPFDTAAVLQFGDHDLATDPRALIAPLMTTASSQLLGEPPAVRVRHAADGVTFTWTSSAHEVQAVLRRSGDVRFSYRRVSELIVGGAVVITSGHEPWRDARAVIASASDPSGDVPSFLQEPLASMLDITSVTVNRIAELDLVELRIKSRGPIDASSLTGEDYLLVTVSIGDRPPYQLIRFWLEPGGAAPSYGLTGWGFQTGSTAARIEDSSIVLTFLDEHIAGARTLPMRVEMAHWSGEDTVATFNVPFGGAPGRVRTEFASASGVVLDNRPIVQTFTAAVLSPAQVWQQVKTAYPHLRDGDIDGVAIYQNFYTDLVTYAGAYSTRGNSAAAGLWPGDTSSRTRPRSPALLHMNTIGYGHNRTLPGASRVLMHELGHRWLFSVGLMEDGDLSNRLNPISSHPAQYVDTRAAFRVSGDRDTSVMGGGHFADNGDGTFTSGPYGPYGYSWLDLYLMGLAAPHEVPNFFYIADSSPRLGDAYYAPPNRTYSGTRRNVALQQIIQANGARLPAYPATQREFRMVTIVVHDPQRAVSESELESVREYMRVTEADFRTATNARGSMQFDIDPPSSTKGRRRAVRH
jgi:hypothetical protein